VFSLLVILAQNSWLRMTEFDKNFSVLKAVGSELKIETAVGLCIK